MSNVESQAKCIKEPWYHWYRFVVLPKLTIKKRDKYNSAGFDFRWLVFRAWTLMSPTFGIGAELSLEAAHVYIIVPYLKLGIFIWPTPYRWQSWVQRHLWLLPRRND